MFRRSVTALALSALVAAAACAPAPETTASSAPEPAPAPQAAPGLAAPAAAEHADHAASAPATVGAAASGPQLTTAPRTIVTPPRPQPGAPHGPGFDMPMITNGGMSPVRPAELVRDAHMFVADHPEVAQFIPCYCGCGTAGHTGNEDCFVVARDATGRVTEWEPHGVTCAVCIDVAVASMRMYNSGASVTAIRATIEKEYQQYAQSMTPTPRPPAR